jgi:hypothetical protein
MTLMQPLNDSTFTDMQAEAALYFLPQGHYLFCWQEEAGLTGSKFVTVDDLAAAFSNSERDTGWLAPGIVRAGYGSALEVRDASICAMKTYRSAGSFGQPPFL